GGAGGLFRGPLAAPAGVAIPAGTVRLPIKEGTMKTNRTLWTIQALLAAIFLFAGSMKLVLPIEAMAGPVALPGPFLRFIGIAEVLGGVGLVLPWLLKIRPILTPTPAAGLVFAMAVAVVARAVGGMVGGAP